MNPVKALWTRASLAQRMIVDSRRGYTYARDSDGGLMPAAPVERRTELEEYFDAHETGAGLWKWRHYFPVYERHLEKFKGGPVDIVEIGVFSGGSLDMWRAYFGEQSTVYGVDIQPECRQYEGPGKRIFIGDQGDPAFWARFVADVPEVDIVIDDGGHQFHQQVATFEAIFPHIRPGGVYVCEDVTGELNPFFDYVNGLSRGLQRFATKPRGGGLGREPSAFQQSVDSVHLYPWMAVVEKRAERLEKLVSPPHGNEWQQFLDMKVFAKEKS